MYRSRPPPALASSSSSSSNEQVHVDIRTLLAISRDIAATAPPCAVSQRRNITALVRRASILVALFEELLLSYPERSSHPDYSAVPRPAALCLAEILTVVRRLHALLDDCSATTCRVVLALQFDSVGNEFRQLSHDLATVLDILLLSGIWVSRDVRECVGMLVQQSRRDGSGASSSSSSDAEEELLREEILDVIADLEREVIPDRARLESLFAKLGLTDAESCKEEVVRLEAEIRKGTGERWTVTMVSALGLIRYAKCVLFGASTPRYYDKHRPAFSRTTGGFPDLSDDSDDSPTSSFSSTSIIPQDFRCPITLELMRDPVVAASGQTYDRSSIKKWIDAGHNTCPKTGQPLEHLRLIPNVALRNYITQVCRQHHIPFEPTGDSPVALVDPAAPSSSSSSSSSSSTVAVASSTCPALPSNKAALEAARMTALFLVQKLSSETVTTESLNRIVHELRQLAKSAPENRAFIAEAGAIPLLLPLLRSADPSLQVNAVTALLNLSILDDNKKRIMHEPEGLSSIAGVLVSGATWPARENAAAALLSLSSLHSSYRKRVGRHRKVAEGLADLVRAGPESSKRDGLITILNLAGARENIAKLVDGGVIEATLAAVGNSDVAEMAVAVLAALAKRGAALQVGSTEGFVLKMISVLRQGTELAKEAAAAALVSVCHLGGADPMAELAKTPGIEWLIWGLMASGSVRAKRKAASLGRMYRRWMAAQHLAQVIDVSSSTTTLSVLTPAVS